MKVQLNATGFRLRDDTESVKESPGVIKFLTDHGVNFTRYHTPETKMSNVTFPAEDRVQWHEDLSVVDIECNTIEELRAYCKKYDACFEITEKWAKISFQ